jgi:hypothetical protein
VHASAAMGNLQKRFLSLSLLILAMLALLPSVARAQEFGVVESAETIDRGTFKLRVNPMFVFGKDGADDDAGVAGHLGYGFTDRFDAEVGVALYDGMRFFGVDGEYWLVQDPGLDFSIIAGVHMASGDRIADQRSFDLTFLGSRSIGSRTEVYAGLDFGFKKLSDVDFSYKTVHLVPGIEYRIQEDLDFVGEFGIGLNDDSWHYLSGGLAFYFR